jgi:hypothetical protein
MKRFFFLTLLMALLCHGTRANAASYKIENVTASPAGLPDAVKSTLQTEGIRIVDDQGSTFCEVWVRKEIANLNKPASPDAKYPALHLGSLLGVIKFAAAGSDYRGQPIKPGTYTMRYCLVPQDGNHMGVAPILDFVLLVPAAEDHQDADAVLTFEEVVNLSRKASGTNHPACISLAPPPASVTAPVFEKDELDRWVLKAKTRSKPETDLPVGIVLVGRSEG